jgi:hypothetical protein
VAQDDTKLCQMHTSIHIHGYQPQCQPAAVGMLMQVAAAASLGSLIRVMSCALILQQDAARQDRAHRCDHSHVHTSLDGADSLSHAASVCLCVLAGQDHEGVGPHRTQRPTHTSARCGQGEPQSSRSQAVSVTNGIGSCCIPLLI